MIDEECPPPSDAPGPAAGHHYTSTGEALVVVVVAVVRVVPVVAVVRVGAESDWGLCILVVHKTLTPQRGLEPGATAGLTRSQS